MSGLFLFDALDPILDRSRKRRRIGQVTFRHLKLRHQHAVAVDKDQAISRFHGATLPSFSCDTAHSTGDLCDLADERLVRLRFPAMKHERDPIRLEILEMTRLRVQNV